MKYEYRNADWQHRVAFCIQYMGIAGAAAAGRAHSRFDASAFAWTVDSRSSGASQRRGFVRVRRVDRRTGCESG